MRQRSYRAESDCNMNGRTDWLKRGSRPSQQQVRDATYPFFESLACQIYTTTQSCLKVAGYALERNK
jgi:hypothetical protein